MGQFVVSGCDTPPLFEFGEEPLDAPAVFIGKLVVAVLVPTVAAGRNDRLAALVENNVVQPIGIIGPVGDHLSCRQALDQVAGRCHIVLLARADLEAHGQAQRIYDNVEFGAKTPARAAESLGFRSPLLRRAPAAWACARIPVASMATHSRSGSSAAASNKRSKTPASIQR